MASHLLTQSQLDTLTELFNIGVGKAAAVLHEMIDEEVSLSIPVIECSAFEDAIKSLSIPASNKVEAVEQNFSGKFSGVSVLVFSEQSSFRLVQRVLGSDIPHDELSEMEQDALKEVANIILNACFGSISDILNIPLESSIPKLVTGSCEDVFRHTQLPADSNNADDPVALVMKVIFDLPGGQISGNISYILTADSADTLAQELDSFLANI